MSATGHQLSESPNASPLESQFGVILNALPEAVVIVNSQDRIVLANESAERLFGYSSSALLGLPVESLVSQRFRNPHSLNGSADTPPDLLGLRRDNSEFPLAISRQPLQTEHGGYALITLRDITEQKRLQQELREKSAALESAHEEFHAFSHSISHDLRAPLRAMDGFATMLRRSLGENVSKESEHAVNRIQENASKMSKLIEGLLDFSTLSWVALTKKKVEPRTIAQKSFEGLSFSVKDRRVDFSVGELPACEADVALLRRLFDNLLSNALKYTHKQDTSVIRIGSHDENGEHVYFVQDNGVGFDMEYAGKLFHIFQRLHSPSEYEGAGVGLAIVQRIVQRHGGRIWAESQVDRGATFYFTLGNSDYGNSA